ncbi:MAG: hypothetical protein HN742_15315 [Lentisphaerae bacterium]|nr:hypothetical protein [Lentisphaerota bacterium]MBT4817584.1 hypothetical protein [Lentisphaerota bacterium]MBT5608529.1 hypothetical protein [Lentisphaerota bacterium]MBT7060242.1 hypothetical protein [Lentisphaerota bacterium]MBT7843246.1 hypothetical protein [Lentisphaerota bacterium]
MLDRIAAVADKLRPLNVDFAFLGGAVLGLLVTDTGAAEVRTTRDVDVIIDSTSRRSQTALEDALRVAGFRHDTSEDAPVCRWLLQDIVVDIIPVDASVFGWGSTWLAEALAGSRPVCIGDGHEIKVVTPPCFVATKLEAFEGRGASDYYASIDLEDVVTVLDTRAELRAEVATSPPDVRAYLVREFRRLLGTTGFRDALPGHLPMDSASQRRVSVVLERMRGIVADADADVTSPLAT